MRLSLVLRTDHVGGIPSGQAFRDFLTLTKLNERSDSWIVAAIYFVQFLLEKIDSGDNAVRRFLLGTLLGHWPATECIARCEKAFEQDISRVEFAFHVYCEQLRMQARKADEPRQQASRDSFMKARLN